MLLDDLRDPSDAIRVAQRIQEKCAAPFSISDQDSDEQEIVVTASIGIALSALSYSHAEDLLRDSEIAMYRAKRGGKARCELFDSGMHESAVKRLRMETDIGKASTWTNSVCTTSRWSICRQEKFPASKLLPAGTSPRAWSRLLNLFRWLTRRGSYFP